MYLWLCGWQMRWSAALLKRTYCKSLTENFDAYVQYVEGCVQRKKTPAANQQLRVRRLMNSASELSSLCLNFLCTLYSRARESWGVTFDPSHEAPISTLGPFNNGTLSHRRGSNRPWSRVPSDGGFRHLRRRSRAASPAPSLSLASQWKEWSREQGAVNKSEGRETQKGYLGSLFSIYRARSVPFSAHTQNRQQGNVRKY